MSEGKTIRLASAAKELNVGTATIVDHLHAKGFKDVENKPNTKLTEEQYNILQRDFMQSIAIKEKAEQISIGKRKEDEITIKELKKEEPKEEEVVSVKREIEAPKVLGKIDLDKPKKSAPAKEEAPEAPAPQPEPEQPAPAPAPV